MGLFYIYIYTMGGECGAYGEETGCTGCLWGNLRERGYWEDKDVHGRIILRWISRTLEVVVGIGWRWLRIRTGDGHL
jgi:hypothetical protein